MKIGTIQSIWRYPVKGMAGEKLRSCYIDHAGLKGDRIWAVQDVQRQEIQSCKYRPKLLQCHAKYISDGIKAHTEITFPNHQTLSCSDPEASEDVSALLGYESLLRSLEPISNHTFYKRYKIDNDTWLKELKETFAREQGEPLPDLDNLPQTMQDYVTLPGSFFLVSPLHIITTASLTYMKQHSPSSDWSIERFRPNIVINTIDSLTGLTEQDWIGKQIHIGKITIECSGTTPRCGAVIRPQRNLNEDKTVLRHIITDADQNLGVYGNISDTDTINVGDEVYLR